MTLKALGNDFTSLRTRHPNNGMGLETQISPTLWLASRLVISAAVIAVPGIFSPLEVARCRISSKAQVNFVIIIL